MAVDFWNPNYTKVFKKRQERYLKIAANPNLILGAKTYYSQRPADFVEDWCITYDPRNANSEKPAIMPFILFKRQREFADFIMDCLFDQQSGLVEKTRDVGATWLCCCLSVWLWLFLQGSAVGWGSRKEALVDKLGDPDSIFEKIRMVIRFLPRFFWPKGFDFKKNCSHMKIINPENGSTIMGEAGDNIGRGGRSLIHFSDESSHYERPDLIEAALSHNTNVQIDISSVNGTGNVFYRKRQSGEIWSPGCKIEPGITRVFIFDWRDHPHKTQEWYNTKRAKAEREGLLHVFAQEVDRDYLSAVDRICIPNKWVMAAIDAHKKLPIPSTGIKLAALDVADEGGDKNAYTERYGNICVKSIAWGEGDTADTTRKALTYMQQSGIINLQYDSIGVGSGIKASINVLRNHIKYCKKVSLTKWNAGARPLYAEQRIIKGDKETPKNIDFYRNLKSQAWWQARIRFEKTYNATTKGMQYDPDELISIDSSIEDLHQLVNELSQSTYDTDNAGKIIIEKTPVGTKSPNRADSFVMAFWPCRTKKVMI